jgi:hypothetical protein
MSAWFKRVQRLDGDQAVEYYENLEREGGPRPILRSDADVIVVHGAMFDLSAFRHVVIEHLGPGERAVARIYYGSIGSTPNLTLRGPLALAIRDALVERLAGPG